MRRYSVHLMASIVSSMLLLGPGTARAQTGPARVVRDINTTPTSSSGSSPGNLVEFRGLAFFTAFSLETGAELWKSDGTEAGTLLVKDIRPGPVSSNAGNLTVVGDTLFFFANDGTHGSELWKSDGSEAGTVLVKDIQPGPFGSSSSGRMAGAGETLFLVADDGEHGNELWKSDGTKRAHRSSWTSIRVPTVPSSSR